MIQQRNELRETAKAAVWYAETYQWWFPGKYATIAVLKRAVEDDKVLDELVKRRAAVGDDPPLPSPTPIPPPPTLADLIAMIFEVVLLVYAPVFPFGGYWVRAVEAFVLKYLDVLIPVLPRTLRYGTIR